MRYAIDIDGTLTMETEGWEYEKRTPNLARIKGVNLLYEQGHTIILWSSRYETDLATTEMWLEKYGVKHDELILGKMQYDYIIDDKSLPLSYLEG